MASKNKARETNPAPKNKKPLKDRVQTGKEVQLQRKSGEKKKGTKEKRRKGGAQKLKSHEFRKRRNCCRNPRILGIGYGQNGRAGETRPQRDVFRKRIGSKEEDNEKFRRELGQVKFRRETKNQTEGKKDPFRRKKPGGGNSKVRGKREKSQRGILPEAYLQGWKAITNTS